MKGTKKKMPGRMACMGNPKNSGERSTAILALLFTVELQEHKIPISGKGLRNFMAIVVEDQSAQTVPSHHESTLFDIVKDI